MTEARTLVDALGGYRSVAMELGVKPTTLHTYLSARLPAKWYLAFCQLSARHQLPPPRMSAFAFVSLPDNMLDTERGAA